MPEAQAQFSLGRGVTLDNHTNSLAEVSDNMQRHLHICTPQHSSGPWSFSASDSAPGSQTKQPRIRVDQFCVYGDLDGAKKLSFLIEYMHPHKLSVGSLRAGLRSMVLRRDIVDQTTIPVYREHADGSKEGDEAAKKAKLGYG
ncbi:MAG: hypothetical protein MMC23_010139 [Stictis urceolatum]|nr:hypothetical protein [Stictis urceolata]